MSNPEENEFLHGLEVEVQAEIDIVVSSHFEEVAGTPVTEWQFDPADAERYEVGLHGLLGAVEAVEDAERGHR
ncbi:hypothetical protein C8D88_1364 [Lentzea atacamensis]|uniref:Uncharacterized protein n=2 Tax=Lentzea TaxID=165301 RepID=A0A316HAI6_9PSEU|nr:hypothetical protein [Lentzea atacamensis]PWK77476.1 hypothetical protein C8D88_1364 [Lentzea atacamensis]